MTNKGIAIFENTKITVTVEYDENKLIDSTLKDGKIVKLDQPITGAYEICAYAKEWQGNTQFPRLYSWCYALTVDEAIKTASQYIAETL